MKSVLLYFTEKFSTLHCASNITFLYPNVYEVSAAV
jgi:hypothetical protein